MTDGHIGTDARLHALAVNRYTQLRGTTAYTRTQWQPTERGTDTRIIYRLRTVKDAEARYTAEPVATIERGTASGNRYVYRVVEDVRGIIGYTFSLKSLVRAAMSVYSAESRLALGRDGQATRASMTASATVAAAIEDIVAMSVKVADGADATERDVVEAFGKSDAMDTTDVTDAIAAD